ncbi:helix-turn-helix domain-containing protein [Schleiferilactobacillus harbinensis]|uniref:Uncharacterized protein n=1 Tax=Schleiferilactobacillus harbinensis TaxID=304207 RepID=A0A5P8M0I8_9LACO|nr:Rgg/GadR/MutR family transcriptional regulator [Schleiferilactobacillus harbinensis]QEU48131.1 hypothetical protein FMM01_12890 [Schleiferilactobacillus harbinensis]QFR22000.1 hypothetical protein D1010_00285 [Schleiferilactobacillus harbinensis]
MAALGKTVRQIRKNKGLTLMDVADDQLTASFLSKFERGLADMSTNRFLHLLDRIFTTPEEFFYIHNGTPTEKKGSKDGYYSRTAMLDRLFGNYLSLDSPADIQQTLTDLTRREKAAAAQYKAAPTLLNVLHWRIQQVMRQMITRLEQQRPLTSLNNTGQYSAEAQNYLYNVSDWGEFELYVFTLFSLDMPVADERRLFKVAVKRSKKYSTFPGAPRLRFDMIFNQLFLEMNRQAYPVVGDYLDQYKAALTAEPNAEHEISYRFIRAWWLYRTGQRDAAATVGQSAIQLATALRMTKLAQDVQDELTQVATHAPAEDYKFFRQIIE